MSHRAGSKTPAHAPPAVAAVAPVATHQRAEHLFHAFLAPARVGQLGFGQRDFDLRHALEDLGIFQHRERVGGRRTLHGRGGRLWPGAGTFSRLAWSRTRGCVGDVTCLRQCRFLHAYNTARATTLRSRHTRQIRRSNKKWLRQSAAPLSRQPTLGALSPAPPEPCGALRSALT